METNSKWIKFNYKSALLFFAITILTNLIFLPVLTSFGISRPFGLFLLTSIGSSAGLSFILLAKHGFYKTKKQATIFTAVVTLVCTASCYFLMYLS
ncbi:hypothetical protein PWEIH_00330 [Listeria weihenstephanensis FSL R9-0317]|uniref:Uncharacterized protein n=1 Tax=Listeria weihenstephanensis TaxID=1006155 RepID=A0A1S7FSN1_9LIST|nr:hypothetical protein [Listeria weihenstephanensis]AQY50451.1 hypothetical protein UE46_05020 [Listeria weihenstephanensis]EUJ41464.1 hypothetical protein PWEIH_00330 [Listeria weihenstephanensis FSL R9-0317]MBC1501563.1 hypothetical protein [Listeria weihenstephanensis]